jgi:glycosyltransferase involved in cell wall biosynthesis
VPSTLFIVENCPVPTDPRVWAECLTLRDAGWDVSVISPVGVTRDTAQREIIDGIEVQRFPSPGRAPGARGYLAEYGGALWQIARLARRISGDRRLDVVHVATPPDVILTAVNALRRRGAAAILDHHDLSPELFEAKFGRRGPLYWSLLRAERLGFALADVVVSPNESYRRIAMQRGGKAPDDVFVVRNGPDPDVFKAAEVDPSLAHGSRYLLGYVGHMGRQDGIEEAMRALAALHVLRQDWHAVFVGDGEALDPARRLSRELGIEESVSFTGFVHDRRRVVEIISSCDICLAPEPDNALNRQSTLIKVAEYMSVSRPVVANDLTETRATGADAVAYASNPGPAAFASAIDELLDDPIRRARLGELGRRRVEEQLGWPLARQRLLAAYERALARAASRRGGRAR